MPEEQSTTQILSSQLSSAQDQIAALIAERESLHAALSDIGAERDQLRESYQSPGELAQRVHELESSIRDRNHFDKFAELAGAAKAKAKALRQLWRDAKDRGYEPDGDPDEKALQSLVAKLKTEVDYAFDIDPADAAVEARENVRKPTSRTKYGLDVEGPITPGGGRSGERNKGADGTIVTQEMRADPKFMLDPKNREMIRDAALGGRFR